MAGAKMTCPACGEQMNHHADKLLDDAGDGSRLNVFNGIIKEIHACPGCGKVEWREQE
jgi:predicted RNA-binding Zn-ribbon protein involved in translation (DUF1610 family)